MTAAARPERFDLPGAGLRLAADRWGPRTDDVVVFLHGAGQSRRAWDDAARALAPLGWHAITVDHRGHGDSEWPTEADYDWDRFADDVVAIVEHLGTPPVLVGASLGGMSALLAQARTDEQLFRALVLVDVTPRMELRGVQRIVGFMTAHPDGFESLGTASAIIAEYTGRPRPPTPDGLRQVLAEGPDGRWRWRWDVRFLEGRAEMIIDGDIEALREAHVRERLHEGAGRIRVPALVVRGADSDLVSAAGVREFVDAVPGAQYVDVAHAGHMVAGDQNDTFSAAVLTFLAGLRSGTTEP